MTWNNSVPVFLIEYIEKGLDATFSGNKLVNIFASKLEDCL